MALSCMSPRNPTASGRKRQYLAPVVRSEAVPLAGPSVLMCTKFDCTDVGMPGVCASDCVSCGADPVCCIVPLSCG